MLNINVIHTQYITVFMLIILKPVIKLPVIIKHIFSCNFHLKSNGLGSGHGVLTLGSSMGTSNVMDTVRFSMSDSGVK